MILHPRIQIRGKIYTTGLNNFYTNEYTWEDLIAARNECSTDECSPNHDAYLSIMRWFEEHPEEKKAAEEHIRHLHGATE